MNECTKCIHHPVCKTAESCDGYVSGCEHFKEQKQVRMDVREKLVELFAVTSLEFEDAVTLADHLIAHGVTVQEWYSASNPPKEDGTYLVQTNTGTITTARFYAFKSFPATKYLPACHRSPSWQSNRNVVKWTYLAQPPKGE